MKKYEEIWVPTDPGETIPSVSFQRGTKFFKPLSGSIVLTLEEARDLFHAGVRYIEGLETSYYNGRPNFEAYLQSKGISI